MSKLLESLDVLAGGQIEQSEIGENDILVVDDLS
jgi:hypothetical protein